MNYSIILIFILMVLAAVASLQFYRGRKINVELMEKSIEAVRRVVIPKDKDFTWLGGYVGYRAYFKVKRENIEEIDFTVTLIPRQSAFYYPIAKLTTRHDRIYIVVYPYTEIPREAHLIQRNYYHLRPKIENEYVFKKGDVEIRSGKEKIYYTTIFENKRDVKRLKDLLLNLSEPNNVKHLSMTPTTNVFYLFMRLNVDTLEEDIKKIVEFVNEELPKL